MAKKDFSEELKAVNQSLKQERTGVTLYQRGYSLYARGTFPPKPGSTKVAPHQQEIALKVGADHAGIVWANDEARCIGVLLRRQEFDWQRYLAPEQTKADTVWVSAWIQAFEAEYFAKRERTPESESTWRAHYKYYLRMLPQDQPLTVELLNQAVRKTKPDSCARKELCFCSAALGRFAKLDIAFLADLRGTYSSNKPKPRDLPSDEVIIESAKKIPDPGLRWVYGMVATYGLRPHEVFNLDTQELEAGGSRIRVLKGKTGPRWARPLFKEGIDLFDLRVNRRPNLHFEHNYKYGQRVCDAFRKYELPFKPYDLRHAWAVRALRLGLSSTWAAKWMGHSVTMHTRTYQQWISQDAEEQAFETFMQDIHWPQAPGTSVPLQSALLAQPKPSTALFEERRESALTMAANTTAATPIAALTAQNSAQDLLLLPQPETQCSRSRRSRPRAEDQSLIQLSLWSAPA